MTSHEIHFYDPVKHHLVLSNDRVVSIPSPVCEAANDADEVDRVAEWAYANKVISRTDRVGMYA